MNTCYYCGEPCGFDMPFHGKCHLNSEQENLGTPQVVGVICSDSTTPHQLKSAIEDVVKTMPPHSNVVIKI